MARDRLELESFADTGMDRFQGAVGRALRDVETRAQESLDSTFGTLLKDIDLTTTAVEFEHDIGAEWLEYTVRKRDAGVVIYHTASSNESKYIKLVATGNVTATVEVHGSRPLTAAEEAELFRR